MGIYFKAVVFYGMPVANDDDLDLYEIFTESDGPLEEMNTSPMTSNGIDMLFVRESHHAADEHSDEVLLPLSSVMGKEAEWRQYFVDACAEHGLTFVEPEWYFASTYS